MQAILNLPTLLCNHPGKIHAFYEKLVSNVQALETMGKLTEIKGYVRNTLDKVGVIRPDLVRNDDDWQEWSFPQLVETLRKWTERNPIEAHRRQENPGKVVRMLNTRQEGRPNNACVCCESKDHKSIDCPAITIVNERKQILSKKRLCFNCTGAKHRATDCRSTRTCRNCNSKHHSSICDQKKKLLKATGEGQVVYPVVIVKVNGVICRALLDTGAGSSNISTALINEAHLKPIRKETKTIEMMLHIAIKSISVYDIQIESTTSSFSLSTTASKVERETLITLPNPRYETLLSSYCHLSGVTINDHDRKDELPIHLILGASEYSQIKVQELPRIGQQGEPIAELTRFGWVIILPGRETDLTKMMLTRTTAQDFDRLCALDVIGIENDHGKESILQQDFFDQLAKDRNGCYETNLLRKDQKEVLKDNRTNSLMRLKYLLKRLDKDKYLFDQYKAIIKDQLKEDIIERVEEPQNNTGTVYYMPHKPVIRKEAESTKVRIVYDPSTKSSPFVPSLNELLEPGPSLHNLIWDIMIRIRVRPVILCGDIMKAFLQIRIRKADRDALRFHWLTDDDKGEIATYRLERLLFGLVQSSFILNAVIKHLLANSTIEEKIKKQIERDVYVDDIITGSSSIDEVKELKEIIINTFHNGDFQLHKWHSNEEQLEKDDNLISIDDQSQQTFAKEQLGVRPRETKILGLSWDKKQDTLSVDIPIPISKHTKRSVLQKLASIYDPLGIISPITVAGKMIFREICDSKIGWDAELPDEIRKKWEKWEQNLPSRVLFPRAFHLLQETISLIEVHVFGDASFLGICAAAYVIIHQPSGVKQGLIASKSRVAKKGLTIPRLELVAAQTSANLAVNIKNAFQDRNVILYGWSDSTTVLHWIQGQGSYKQFVENRVRHIKSKGLSQWNYVSSAENPADLGSRGCNMTKLDSSWCYGPEWLKNVNKWPEQTEINATPDSTKEEELSENMLLTPLRNRSTT